MPDPRYRFEPLLFQAVTPVHVGSGQDVGIVDLPVVRERTTGHPYLPGSGIRGTLRDRCEAADPAMTTRLFGNEESGEISAGCVSILDAHLLLFPVRSAPGLFHWITCPFVLHRHRRLLHELCGADSFLPACDATPEPGTYLGGGTGLLYLEEYPFEKGDGVWTWGLSLEAVDPARVVLISDDDYLHFVKTATIVRQRNRLSTAKTVLQGQLFSVESLPAETCFLGFFGATQERVSEVRDDQSSEGRAEGSLNKDAAARQLRRLATDGEESRETYLTLGGDESVGLGITRVEWLATANASAEGGGT